MRGYCDLIFNGFIMINEWKILDIKYNCRYLITRIVSAKVSFLSIMLT